MTTIKERAREYADGRWPMSIGRTDEQREAYWYASAEGYEAGWQERARSAQEIVSAKLHELAASLASGRYANEIAEVRREIESKLRGSV